jgi:hypothetical protein
MVLERRSHLAVSPRQCMFANRRLGAAGRGHLRRLQHAASKSASLPRQSINKEIGTLVSISSGPRRFLPDSIQLHV